jgi:adenosylcobyric acid synthase
MLGREISDPEHVEAGGSMRGMGLLPMRTIFEGNKVRRQVSDVTGPLQGIWKEISKTPYEGYEIHMGRSIWEEDKDDSSQTGLDDKGRVVSRGNICGTYVHGIFDSKEMQQAVIGMLLHRKGLEPGDGLFMDQKDYKEQQFDILADGVRRNMDMDMVYRILNG